MNYLIKDVSTKKELEKTFDLFKIIFKGIHVIDNPEYSFEKWEQRMKKHGDLMLYASLDNEVIGIVFGRINENNSLTMGPVAMHENYRGAGIAKEMIFMLEERATRYGIHTVNLGSVEFTNIYNGKISQVCLHLTEPNRDLQKEYESSLSGCYTQMM